MKILSVTQKYKIICLILFAFICLFTGCNSVSPENDDDARTYYESLSLDSPEAAVETFAESFQKQDFFTVFLVLSPSTQIRVENNINTLNYKELIDVENLAEAEEMLANTPQFQLMSEWEHLGSVSIYLFDSIMLAAGQNSNFLIDLSGDTSILNSEPRSDGSEVDVFANVEGIDGDIIFRTEQAPSGRWRIKQVIVPGGNEDLVPWTVPDEE